MYPIVTVLNPARLIKPRGVRRFWRTEKLITISGQQFIDDVYGSPNTFHKLSLTSEQDRMGERRKSASTSYVDYHSNFCITIQVESSDPKMSIIWDPRCQNCEGDALINQVCGSQHRKYNNMDSIHENMKPTDNPRF